MVTSPPDLEARVLQMVSEVSAVPVAKLRSEHRLREDLNLDSVASMELVSMIDEELGMEVELEDALAVETVGDVIELLKAHAS